MPWMWHDAPSTACTRSRISSRLRINHYYRKSLEEARAKYAKPLADTGELRPSGNLEGFLESQPNHQRDTTILRYLPALRKALAE
jgi:hypothetical protein